MTNFQILVQNFVEKINSLEEEPLKEVDQNAKQKPKVPVEDLELEALEKEYKKSRKNDKENVNLEKKEKTLKIDKNEKSATKEKKIQLKQLKKFETVQFRSVSNEPGQHLKIFYQDTYAIGFESVNNITLKGFSLCRII